MIRKSDYFERNDSWLKVGLIYAILIIGCFLTVYPILNVFSVSMRPGSSLYSTSLAIFPDIDKLKWVGLSSSEDGKNVAAVAKRSNIFLSADQGATWKELRSLETSRGEIDGDLNWQSLDMSSDGKTIVVAEEGKRATDKGSIYISTNGGEKWTAGKNTDAKWVDAVVSGDGKHVYAISKRRSELVLFHSEDGCSSWTELTSAGGKDWTSIDSSPDGSKLIAGRRMNLCISPMTSAKNGPRFRRFPKRHGKSYV